MAYAVGKPDQTCDSIVRRLLSTALHELEWDTFDCAHALRTCALLMPGKCLQLLAENAPAIHGVVDRSALARIIDSVFDELPSNGTLPDHGVFEALAAAYRDDLTPRSLTALAAHFPERIPATVVQAVEEGLSRSPNDPLLLRAARKVAQGDNDFALMDRLSTKLGLVDNTPATVASLYRSRRRTGTLHAGVRVALLSSYTLDHLIPFIDLECRALELDPHIYLGPFNSWTQETIDETSGLRSFAPDITFLAVSIDDLVPQLAQPLSAGELEEAGTLALRRIGTAVIGYLAWASGRPLVVHGFHSVFGAGPLGIVDCREGLSRREWLAELNLRLETMLRDLPGAYFLDVSETVARSGASLADNAKLRHFGAMRLPPPALGAIAKAYARYIAPVKGLTKKCVVLDLDNTLWGGVAGEDGKDGIRLGHTSPGSEYVEFQYFLSGLSRRGIMLAVNSKNNADDALDVIRTHESMVLREAAFSAMRINWRPKPENMAAIARELNIGLDSLVFVDDNPDERELMRQTWPEILTVELPKDPAQYRSVLDGLPQLQVLAVTEEDRSRAKHYRSARERDEFKLSATSADDYLHSLQIEARVALASTPIFDRVTQLFARTNQFNATTRRYSASDVERFAQDPSWRLYVLHSRDRFSDHGLVAVGLVEVRGETWTIDSFLMSCRVIGYGIESGLLSFISQAAAGSGAALLRGQFLHTRKNEPAKDIYSRHGFVAAGIVDAIECWERPLHDGPIPCPSWLRLTQHGA